MLKSIINSKALQGITAAWKSKVAAAHEVAAEVCETTWHVCVGRIYLCLLFASHDPTCAWSE